MSSPSTKPQPKTNKVPKRKKKKGFGLRADTMITCHRTLRSFSEQSESNQRAVREQSESSQRLLIEHSEHQKSGSYSRKKHIVLTKVRNKPSETSLKTTKHLNHTI